MISCPPLNWMTPRSILTCRAWVEMVAIGAGAAVGGDQVGQVEGGQHVAVGHQEGVVQPIDERSGPAVPRGWSSKL